MRGKWPHEVEWNHAVPSKHGKEFLLRSNCNENLLIDIFKKVNKTMYILIRSLLLLHGEWIRKKQESNQTISYRVFQDCWLEMIVSCARVTSLGEGDKKKKRGEKRDKIRKRKQSAEHLFKICFKGTIKSPC